MKKRITIISDCLAASFGVTLLLFLGLSLSFDKPISYPRLILDSAVGSAIFVFFILRLHKRQPVVRFWSFLFAVLFSTCLWLIYYFLTGIWVDWRYLSANPEAFLSRHVLDWLEMLALLGPIIVVFVLTSVGFLRAILWLIQNVRKPLS